MKRIIIALVAAATLAACSSQKHAASQSEEQAQLTAQTEVRQDSRQSSDLWATLLAVADSLAMRLSADLVVMTADGDMAVVRPQADVQAKNPRVAAHAAAHSENTDSTVATAAIESSSQQKAQSNSDRETTAVAKPAGAVRYIIVLASLLFLAAWLKKRCG